MHRIIATLLTVTFTLYGCGGGGSAPPATNPQTPPPSPSAFSVPAPASQPRPATAFVGVTVLTMTATESALDDHTVIVRDGRVQTIGPSATTTVPADVEVIDGTGHFLMPGLADMHVHTSNVNNLFLYVANGITTVRMMWGGVDALDRRVEIDTGAILGPRYYTAGPGIDGSPPYWPETVVVEAENEARQAVTEQHQAGYDFIKVYNQLNPIAYNAILDEASRRGMRVIGHIPSAISVEHALASNHVCTEHLLGFSRLVMTSGGAGWGGTIDEQKLTAAVARIRDSGTWTSPTLTVLTRTQNDIARVTSSPGWRYISPGLSDWLQGSLTQPPATRNRQFELNRKRFVKAMHDGGAPLLLGTDVGVQYLIPGYSLHEELAHWVDAGLTPEQVLNVATASAARWSSPSRRTRAPAPMAATRWAA